MISNTLLICIGAASAAIVVALMMWKPRRRLSANAEAEIAHARNTTFGSTLLSFAAAIGLARAQDEHARGGNADHSWHGSHLDHSSHGGGGYSDGGGGFSGGDSGGGGL